MSESFSLPVEAVKQMEKDLEGIRPVITVRQLTELCAGDEVLTKLAQDFINYSMRYAQDVWNMQKFINSSGLSTEEDIEKFKEIDDARTRLHNTLVESIGILSRALGNSERDNEWVRPLLNSDGQGLSRAACGSLALLLVYNSYLDSRPKIS